MKKLEDKDILANVIKALGTNKSQFATSIQSKSRSTVFNILYGLHGISDEMIMKINTAFPQVNISYLTTGEGEILNNTGVATNPVDRKINETLAIYDRLGRIEVTQKELNEKFDKSIALQEQILKFLINQ